jgi:hypothetical protein
MGTRAAVPGREKRAPVASQYEVAWRHGGVEDSYVRTQWKVLTVVADSYYSATARTFVVP